MQGFGDRTVVKLAIKSDCPQNRINGFEMKKAIAKNTPQKREAAAADYLLLYRENALQTTLATHTVAKPLHEWLQINLDGGAGIPQVVRLEHLRV